MKSLYRVIFKIFSNQLNRCRPLSELVQMSAPHPLMMVKHPSRCYHLGLRPLIRGGREKQEITCFCPTSRTNDSQQKMMTKKHKFTLFLKGSKRAELARWFPWEWGQFFPPNKLHLRPWPNKCSSIYEGNGSRYWKS